MAFFLLASCVRFVFFPGVSRGWRLAFVRDNPSSPCTCAAIQPRCHRLLLFRSPLPKSDTAAVWPVYSYQPTYTPMHTHLYAYTYLPSIHTFHFLGTCANQNKKLQIRWSKTTWLTYFTSANCPFNASTKSILEKSSPPPERHVKPLFPSKQCTSYYISPYKVACLLSIIILYYFLLHSSFKRSFLLPTVYRQNSMYIPTLSGGKKLVRTAPTMTEQQDSLTNHHRWRATHLFVSRSCAVGSDNVFLNYLLLYTCMHPF